MDRQERKTKSPYRWLLAIPVQMLINVLLVPLGVWVDMRFWEAARVTAEEQGYIGHGIPVFTVLVPLAGAVVTVIVVVVSFICTIVSLVRLDRKQRQYNPDNSHIKE